MKENISKILLIVVMIVFCSSCSKNIRKSTFVKPDESAILESMEAKKRIEEVNEKLKNKHIIATLSEGVAKNDNMSVAVGETNEKATKEMIGNVYYYREKNKWIFGIIPVTWIYVEPNKQIVSNYKPNGSAKYSIPEGAMSGKDGCFLPIFSGTENYNKYFEGRFCCFEDTRHNPKNFKYTNTLKDVMYKGMSVYDILDKYYQFDELENGLLDTDAGLINIIYASELNEILELIAVG